MQSGRVATAQLSLVVAVRACVRVRVRVRLGVAQEALAVVDREGSGETAEDEVARLQAEANIPIDALMRAEYGVSMDAGTEGSSPRSSVSEAEDLYLDSEEDGFGFGSDAEGQVDDPGRASAGRSSSGPDTSAAKSAVVMVAQGTNSGVATTSVKANGSWGGERGLEKAEGATAGLGGVDGSTGGEARTHPPSGSPLTAPPLSLPSASPPGEQMAGDKGGSTGAEEGDAPHAQDARSQPRRRSAAAAASLAVAAAGSGDRPGGMVKMEALPWRGDKGIGLPTARSWGTRAGNSDAYFEDEGKEGDDGDGGGGGGGVDATGDPGEDEFVFREELDDETTLEAEVSRGRVCSRSVSSPRSCVCLAGSQPLCFMPWSTA